MVKDLLKKFNHDTDLDGELRLVPDHRGNTEELRLIDASPYGQKADVAVILPPREHGVCPMVINWTDKVSPHDYGELISFLQKYQNRIFQPLYRK